MSTAAAPLTSLSRLQEAFAPAPGYLNAATMGLPPTPALAAMREDLMRWQSGRADAHVYDTDVAHARTLYAGLVGVPTSWVATGSQTSVFAGTVAASLPEGAEVVVVADDFTSMVFPFLVQADRRDVTVRQVPRAQVAGAVTDRTSLVAFSLVQSACGSLCDGAGIVEAARAHGALTLVDLTQAAGWLPVEAGAYDMTVCSAYKWLCHPRGTAYFTVRPEVLDRLTPVNAGWYAGADIWESCYGPDMQLSPDARRFDVSPAWLSWVGAAPAMELMTGVAVETIRGHDVGLADDLRERLGLPAADSAIVSFPDPDGRLAARLAERDAVVASRGGRVRISFHVWNTGADVDLVAAALR